MSDRSRMAKTAKSGLGSRHFSHQVSRRPARFVSPVDAEVLGSGGLDKRRGTWTTD